jgi:hypothetical protein
MAKLVGSPTFHSTFTYQKGTKNTSLVDLLLSKGIVDNHYFHKISHSFLKVVPSEKTSITIGVAIVDNTESTIQVGGHTPRTVLLDTNTQLIILGVQFVKKMGMFNFKLRKSMWQIRTTSGSIEDVATPLWPSLGVKPNTWKSWGFGVLRDSRMFRARQQEAKHLELGCSWCR